MKKIINMKKPLIIKNNINKQYNNNNINKQYNNNNINNKYNNKYINKYKNITNKMITRYTMHSVYKINNISMVNKANKKKFEETTNTEKEKENVKRLLKKYAYKNIKQKALNKYLKLCYRSGREVLFNNRQIMSDLFNRSTFQK